MQQRLLADRRTSEEMRRRMEELRATLNPARLLQEIRAAQQQLVEIADRPVLGMCAQLHDRIPVVLKPEVWPEWLGEEHADPPRLKALLASYPAEEMSCWPVSARVGNVKNNDPSLIEQVALAG
jgi:hypothetical protein